MKFSNFDKMYWDDKKSLKALIKLNKIKRWNKINDWIWVHWVFWNNHASFNEFDFMVLKLT